MGAEFEIGNWIWVDHKAGYFVYYRITAWRFESFPDSLNTVKSKKLARRPRDRKLRNASQYRSAPLLWIVSQRCKATPLENRVVNKVDWNVLISRELISPIARQWQTQVKADAICWIIRRLEMPIVKVDVHAPIFYFPKKLKTERVTGKEETLNYVWKTLFLHWRWYRWPSKCSVS